MLFLTCYFSFGVFYNLIQSNHLLYREKFTELNNGISLLAYLWVICVVYPNTLSILSYCFP